MHDAAKYGRLAELKLVIEFAPQRIDETNTSYKTPLHFAAEHDQEAAVRLLLSAKADVNATDIFRRTPLHDAAAWDKEAAVGLLLSAKADVNATNGSGATAVATKSISPTLFPLIRVDRVVQTRVVAAVVPGVQPGAPLNNLVPLLQHRGWVSLVA